MNTTKLRPELPPLPQRMLDLPIDPRGYPIPAFVETITMQADFRVASGAFKEAAQRYGLCYVCGESFTTRHRWYVIGPMSVLNRTTSEPAVHRECAVFSATGCPFLARPHAVRRLDNLPENIHIDEASIARNPKVTALYSTRTVEINRRGQAAGDFLLFLGEPEEVHWYASGRSATHTEVIDSIYSGFELLINGALKEQPKNRRAAFQSMRESFNRMLPWLPKYRDNDVDAKILDMEKQIDDAMERA
jgi:hypothetical protein